MPPRRGPTPRCHKSRPPKLCGRAVLTSGANSFNTYQHAVLPSGAAPLPTEEGRGKRQPATVSPPRLHGCRQSALLPPAGALDGMAGGTLASSAAETFTPTSRSRGCRHHGGAHHGGAHYGYCKHSYSCASADPSVETRVNGRSGASTTGQDQATCDSPVDAPHADAVQYHRPRGEEEQPPSASAAAAQSQRQARRAHHHHHHHCRRRGVSGRSVPEGSPHPHLSSPPTNPPPLPHPRPHQRRRAAEVGERPAQGQPVADSDEVVGDNGTRGEAQGKVRSYMETLDGRVFGSLDA